MTTARVVQVARGRWLARRVLQLVCGMTGHFYRRWDAVPALAECVYCHHLNTDTREEPRRV